MDNTSSIPGLTFHVESADYKDSAMFAAKGTVHLSVDIEDLDVWEEVLHRLDGMRVHAVDDFHRQLMTSLQQENEQLLERVTKLAEENRVVKDHAEHADAMIQGTIERMKQVIGKQALEIQQYKNVMDLLVPPAEVVGSGP